MPRPDGATADRRSPRGARAAPACRHPSHGNQQGAERRLVAAARFRDLAEKSLEIEQRRFLTGSSSNINVAQRQDALAAARLAELDALLSHTRAATTLHKVTGRLLEERHIELR